uniref:Uncharacterized protein n=1 Tax=Avena sativa TaxID=4498 RepID=A0ACD6AE43_AVESA
MLTCIALGSCFYSNPKRKLPHPATIENGPIAQCPAYHHYYTSRMMITPCGRRRPSFFYLRHDRGSLPRRRRSKQASSMASFGPGNLPNSEDQRNAGKGTAIFSYTCVGLTGAVIFSVLFFFCYQIRNRAPVAAAGAGTGGRRGRRVDLAKLPEFAYNRSARHSGRGDGAQCSVCLGTVQGGEMVRMLPSCKHLYHVECIDMWLASHDTCPLCRAEVEPPEEDGQPSTELPV